MCQKMQRCDGRCQKPSRHKYTMSYDTQAAKFEALKEQINWVELQQSLADDKLERIEMMLRLLVHELLPEYAEMPEK